MIGAAVVAGACAGGATPRTEAGRIYLRLDCGRCHGPDMMGTRTAPPLVDLADHWTEAALVEYLKDPQRVTSERKDMAYRLESYPLKMPGYSHASDEQLTTLARHLLAG